MSPRLRLLFVICALAACVPLWSVKYLPMTDLPQHAAQIYLWQHLADPDVARTYEINWFTPYVAGYALTRALADHTGIRIALKLVITLAVLAFPLSLAYLFRKAGRDPAWALLGFPLAFGYNFYWGFLNFLVAIPVGIALLGAIIGYGEAPTPRGAALLAIGACALFFGHVLVMLVIVASGGLWLVLRAPRLLTGFLSALPLAAPFPIALFWATLTRSADTQVRGMTMLAGPPPVLRLIGLPGILLGEASDAAALATGAALLLLLVLAMRLSRELHRYAPLAVCLALYTVGPHRAFGTYYLYGRFAVLVMPALILAWEPLKRPRLTPTATATALVLIALSWTAVLTTRFTRFDAEARDFDRIAEKIPAGASLLSLCWSQESPHIPGHFPFLHFPAWHQADHGGLLGFSFATFFPEMLRYRENQAPPMTVDLHWLPDTFNWNVDGSYDCYVVRADNATIPTVFLSRPLERIAQAGKYSLWLNRARVRPRSAILR